MTFLSDASLTELALIVVLAAFSAVTGGVAGYGTGALMPLILVPMVGAAPVVPIIAISALFTNSARVLAFRRLLEPRRALIARRLRAADLRARRLALYAAVRPRRGAGDRHRA